MTVTDAPAPADAAAEPAASRRPSGLAATLGTVDHIVLARLWVVASALFLLAAGVAGALVGVERLDTSSIDVFDNALGELQSLHAVGGIFLFLVPATLGLATAVVPLQLGISTLAFPRGAVTAFWIWFLSGGVLITSYFVDGGPPGVGDVDGAALWLIGLGGVVVGIVLATVTVLTTLLAGRTTGMHLDRVPMFSWSILVAGSVWLVSLPVLLAVLVLQYLANYYGAGVDPSAGWALGAPQVFAYALPALGFMLDAVAVASGRRLRQRGVLLGAIGATGVLSFGGWLVAAGVDPSVFEDALYVGAAFAILLPLLALGGGIADTLRRGKPKITSGLVFGVAAYLMFLTAAAANALRVIDGLDLLGTTADASVVHYALLAGLIGVAGAAHHWSSKIFGVVVPEGPARLAALVLLLGTVLLALPDLVSGFLDQPAGLTTGGDPVEDGVEALNAVALVGGAVVVLGVLLVVVNVLAGTAKRNGDPVPPDPWGTGQTLEWLAASPPAIGGVGPLEPVVSAEPLLDAREREGAVPEEVG